MWPEWTRRRSSPGGTERSSWLGMGMPQYGAPYRYSIGIGQETSGGNPGVAVVSAHTLPAAQYRPSTDCGTAKYLRCSLRKCGCMGLTEPESRDALPADEGEERTDESTSERLKTSPECAHRGRRLIYATRPTLALGIPSVHIHRSKRVGSPERSYRDASSTGESCGDRGAGSSCRRTRVKMFSV